MGIILIAAGIVTLAVGVVQAKRAKGRAWHIAIASGALILLAGIAYLLLTMLLLGGIK